MSDKRNPDYDSFCEHWNVRTTKCVLKLTCPINPKLCQIFIKKFVVTKPKGNP